MAKKSKNYEVYETDNLRCDYIYKDKDGWWRIYVEVLSKEYQEKLRIKSTATWQKETNRDFSGYIKKLKELKNSNISSQDKKTGLDKLISEIADKILESWGAAAEF